MKAYIEYHLRLIQYNIVNEQICYEPSKQSFTMLHCKKKLAGNTTYILLSWRYLCMIHSKKRKGTSIYPSTRCIILRTG